MVIALERLVVILEAVDSLEWLVFMAVAGATVELA